MSRILADAMSRMSRPLLALRSGRPQLCKVLKWWQAKETKWPNLCKMVKQYLAAPASSAGVERVFSAAGKMHGDLSKSVNADTLEYSLFAAINAP